MEWSEGRKRDNSNSIINKYIKKKREREKERERKEKGHGNY